jgi:hypothetical protein
MSSRPKSAPKVRPHDVQVPPSPKPVPPGGHHRRSVPKGVERTAQVLVHEAGSVGKAKKAIDAAAEMERESEFREDQLAIRFSFPTRKDLLAASKPILDANGAQWWATRTKEGRWIVWNDQTVQSTKYATLDEAKRSVADQRTAIEPLTGTAFPEGFNG